MIICRTISRSIFIKDKTIDNKILIRVNAGKEVALGHLKRCVSLALKLREKNSFVYFLTNDDDFSRQLLEKNDFEFKAVDLSYLKSNDLDITLETAKSIGADIIIIDSYDIDYHFRKRLMGEHFFIVSIDDLGDKEIPSHVIINGNPGAEKTGNSSHPDQRLLLGIEYLILGKEFSNYYANRDLSSVENILITMGGIDHYDLTSKIISLLDDFELDFDVTAIIGPYYDNIKFIKDSVKKSNRKINLISAPNSLFKYMEKSSVAFSAGGQALYELASLGCPTIGVYLWENQKGNVEELSNLGAIYGVKYTDDDNFLKNLKKVAFELISNIDIRRKLSTTARYLIDRKGAERASSDILKIYKKSLTRRISGK